MKPILFQASRGSRPAFIFLLAMFVAMGLPVRAHHSNAPDNEQSIRLALLLDTSNSMDGLIEQAKSQLWKIVNELAGARCVDGQRPAIKIALYEYGNDGLPATQGYIRLVAPFTGDLDLISEKLFSLTTNGGSEYCGQVIQTSLNQLAWSAAATDLKIIFIAGNEPFTQGGVSYREACSHAKEKGVVVNTIYCGNFDDGISTNWKSGADLTGGSYMSIEQDRKTVYVPTPYDDRISALNDQLNGTYVYYGKSGEKQYQRQMEQDKNAASYGTSNKADRALSKSSHAYQNSSWDLVDALREDEKAIAKAKDEELPAELQRMSPEDRTAYVKEKMKARESIQKEIQSLSKKRLEYISSHTAANGTPNMLDDVMIKAIRQQAAGKNFTWK